MQDAGKHLVERVSDFFAKLVWPALKGLPRKGGQLVAEAFNKNSLERGCLRAVKHVRESFKHVTMRVRRYPAQAGAVAVCFVVACGCAALSLGMVDRAPSDSSSGVVALAGQASEAGAAGETDVGGTTAADGASAADEPGAADAANAADQQAAEQLAGAAVNQAAAQSLGQAAATVQRVAASIFVTKEAIQALPAAASAPEAFALASPSQGADAGAASENAASAQSSAATTPDLTQLSASLSAIEGQGYDVGCFFMNLDTGKGVAYNLDTRIYGASSFKGPYAAYLSEHLADGAGLSASSRSLMDIMVRNSDNDAFTTLRNAYDASGFSDWVAACGVSTDIVHDTHFPRYSARESALLWFHINQYLQTGSESAQHLRELFTQTNVSFIRDGVASVAGALTSEGDAAAGESGEAGATTTEAEQAPVVMNKAGWNSSGVRFSGLCDAGLIEYGDSTYLMSVMCSAPDSEDHRAQVSQVAANLFALASQLK